jgi:hypothetical protein
VSWGGEEYHDHGNCNTSNGKIDIEAERLSIQPMNGGIFIISAWIWDTYHHRQLSRSAKTPPSNGPATLAILKMIPIKLTYTGACFGGTTHAMIVYVPPTTPPAPIPVMARPAINPALFLVAPREILRKGKMRLHKL